MNAQNLIASIAAVLLTTASLSAVTYIPSMSVQTDHEVTTSAQVTELASVQVRPTAAEMRQAALLPQTAALGQVTTGTELNGADQPGTFSMVGSDLVMPYYSFGNTLGRISKE